MATAPTKADKTLGGLDRNYRNRLCLSADVDRYDDGTREWLHAQGVSYARVPIDGSADVYYFFEHARDVMALLTYLRAHT